MYMHIDDQLKAQNRIYFFLTLFVPNCGFYSIVRYNVYKSLLDEKKKIGKKCFYNSFT